MTEATIEETKAGLKVLADDLRSGKVEHVSYWKVSIRYPNTEVEDKDFFNMTWWSCPTNCGTAHCIGGFLEARIKKKIPGSHFEDQNDADRGGLFTLFYDFVGDPTAAQAADAIDNYLANGHPNWHKVMYGEHER